MHPIILDHPTITAYGLMLLLGLIAAWALARRNARLTAVDVSHLDLLAPLLVAAGLVGAVLFGFLTDALALGDPVHGRVLYGALIAATLTGIIYALVARIPLGILGDIFAAPLALGVAAGRLGCFLAGCCWGKTCAPDFPMAVRFPPGSFAHRAHVTSGLIPWWSPHSLPVHPTQLYEAAAMIVLCVLLLASRRLRHVPGELFLTFGLAYAAIRFALEFVRADNPPIVATLTLSQLVCIPIALLAVATWFIRRRMFRPTV